MNNNTIESIEWHRDQLAKLLSDDDGFYKVESELDSILEKAKTKKKILVRRGGKTFYREQEVGRKDEEKKGNKIGGKDKFSIAEAGNYLRAIGATDSQVKSELESRYVKDGHIYLNDQIKDGKVVVSAVPAEVYDNLKSGYQTYHQKNKDNPNRKWDK